MHYPVNPLICPAQNLAFRLFPLASSGLWGTPSGRARGGDPMIWRGLRRFPSYPRRNARGRDRLTSVARGKIPRIPACHRPGVVDIIGSESDTNDSSAQRQFGPPATGGASPARRIAGSGWHNHSAPRSSTDCGAFLWPTRDTDQEHGDDSSHFRHRRGTRPG